MCVGPPAAAGTTILMVREGKLSAPAGAVQVRRAAQASPNTKVGKFHLPPRRIPIFLFVSSCSTIERMVYYRTN
jgi:hypothetical protein